MPTMYFTPPNNILPPPSFGIGIPDNPAGHQAAVANALINLVHNNAAGNLLVTAICTRIAATGGAVRVGIGPWGPTATNECATVGNQDDAKTLLAFAVEFQAANVPAALTAALTAVGQAPPGGYAWLATAMCNHYIPNITAVPGGAASSTVHGVNWITPLMVQNWATGAVAYPNPLGGQAAIDAGLIMICVLHAGLAAGPGASAQVHWSTVSLTYTDTAGVVHARPPFLALGHELVHAYHNITGTQTGHDTGTPSRVLYEWLCIGLGDWAAEPISENAIRLAGGGLPQRQRY
jgi:hypothetical protein